MPLVGDNVPTLLPPDAPIGTAVSGCNMVGFADSVKLVLIVGMSEGAEDDGLSVEGHWSLVGTADLLAFEGPGLGFCTGVGADGCKLDWLSLG